VLISYRQPDFFVVRYANQVSRREFMEIGNIDMFLESITIASAFNNALQKRLLKPNTIRLIPTGGYSGNVNYSKKPLMLLVYREVTDGCLLMYGRDVRNIDCQNSQT
jgi:hypothetical protein